MTLATTRALLDLAISSRSAVPSFNVIGLEHAEGIVAGAERAGSPVLLQFSESTIAFRGGSPRPILAACREIARAATVPVAFHLDHITQAGLLQQSMVLAADFGLGSVMIDASEWDYDQNVQVTSDFVRSAHEAGLWVEAELGTIGGKGDAHDAGVRTDPAQAADFVAETGIDGLAVAVGSSHRMTHQTAELDMTLIRDLGAAVPVPLVLHGSSGVSDVHLRAAIGSGIRKVNVGTALNQAALAGLREHPSPGWNGSDPRPHLAIARDAIASTVDHLCRVVRGAAYATGR